MERYEIVVDDEGNYCGLIPSENGSVVKYADAQATVEALQARVQELEAIKAPDEAFTYCAYCGEKSPVDEHNEDLSAHIKVCQKHPMRAVEAQLDALVKLDNAVVQERDGLQQQVEALQRIRDEFERERDQLHATLIEATATLDIERVIANQQVEALQWERDEAIEAASLPTWVCDGCGRVSSEGWINRVIDSFEGTDYEMECPTCGVRAIEEDCASDLVRERDDLQAALDAEREKVKFLEKKNANLVEASNLVLKVKADQDERIDELQAQLSALQGLVRVYFTEPDPHKWTAAYQTLKRMGRALPATPTERGQG